MGIAARIKELRIRNGFTQAQLARAVGVTPSAVGNYEQGISFPKESVLRKLFAVLNCTPDELLGYEGLSAEDHEHFRLYSMLTSEGKRAVDECTQREISKASVRIAARRGGSDISLRKRADKSVFDAEDYKR